MVELGEGGSVGSGASVVGGAELAETVTVAVTDGAGGVAEGELSDVSPLAVVGGC
ncbi:MAG TPA: hypothetical protein VFJ14_08225 [Nocardioidaceae bacterium]|nr:hypothetical protein [Nocardioidaceae bacterium]